MTVKVENYVLMWITLRLRLFLGLTDVNYFRLPLFDMLWLFLGLIVMWISFRFLNPNTPHLQLVTFPITNVKEGELSHQQFVTFSITNHTCSLWPSPSLMSRKASFFPASRLQLTRPITISSALALEPGASAECFDKKRAKSCNKAD